MKNGKKLKKWLEKTLNRKSSVVRKYRLSGRHLFLTYAQIGLGREECLEQLRRSLIPREIKNYVISTEDHKSEKGEHLHVYLELDKRCDILDKHRLDLEWDGKKIHGNYQSCRSYNSVIRYVIKEGLEKVLTNMELDDMGRVYNVWKDIIRKAKEGDIKESLATLEETAPRSIVLDYERVKKNLLRLEAENKKKKKSKYSLEEFKIPEEINNYMKKELYRKTLYLQGEPGIGKTEMMKALYDDKFDGAFIRTTDIEGLKKFDGKKHKGIIYDDIAGLETITPENLIGLVDVENDHDQRILYGTAEIPEGTARAWLSNKSLEEQLKHFPKSQLGAIMRRVRNIDLKGKKIILRHIVEVEISEEERERHKEDKEIDIEKKEE